MSLRQRKGNAPASNDVGANKDMSNEEVFAMFEDKMRSALEAKIRSEQENISASELNRQVNEGLTRMFEPKKPPLPGLKHETKAAKDALEKDPYNLELIFDLGEWYVQEEKYNNAANVLIRGWKRVNEFKDPELRFVYLLRLAHASNEDKKFKQAAAVLEDIEEPEDPEMKMDYCRIATKVYANTNNLQKALKAFNQGLEVCKSYGEAKTLDMAMPLWFDVLNSLKKVGAYDAAKSAMDQLATSEDDKKKLKVMESFSEMRASLNAEVTRPLKARIAMGGVLAVLFFIIMYSLYILESRSLKSLKLAK